MELDQLELNTTVEESEKTKPYYTALIGWSVQAIEAAAKMNRPFIVVGPPDFESYAEKHEIPFVGWDFNKINESSDHLYMQLKEMGAEVAVPLYEECVEWAGA